MSGSVNSCCRMARAAWIAGMVFEEAALELEGAIEVNIGRREVVTGGALEDSLGSFSSSWRLLFGFSGTQ